MLRYFLFTLLLIASASAQVPLGASKQEAIDKLGWPKSTSGSAEREILNYPDFTVLLENGRVSKLQPKSKDGRLPRAASGAKSATITSASGHTALPEELLGPTPGKADQWPTLATEPIKPTPIQSPLVAVTPHPSSAAPAIQNTGADSVTFVRPDPFAPVKKLFFWMTAGFGVLAVLKLWARSYFRRNKHRLDPFQHPKSWATSSPSGSSREPPVESRPEPDSIPATWSLALLKEIEWHRFEHLVAAYERELGNAAELTDFGPDGGIDVKVYENDSHTLKRIIQCKAFDNQRVSAAKVRELYGVMALQKVAGGAFYTTSGFTDDALAIGLVDDQLDLVDGSTFLNRIQRLSAPAQLRLIEVATEGDYTTPTCPSCGVKMVLRTARKGRNPGTEFWACATPRCGRTLIKPGLK